MQIKDKVAVVTGGNKGIGKAIAVKLAAEGANLAIIGRDGQSLDSAAGELRSTGREVMTFQGDLTDDRIVEAFVKEAVGHFGRIDILINNAGVGYFAPVAELPVEQWDAMFNLNIRAVFILTQKVLPYLRASGDSFIVNVASLAGKNAFAGGGGYAATKHALLGFSRCLMLEERRNGVHVLTVCPGSVRTDFFNNHHAGEEMRNKNILRPEDVAETVVRAMQLPPHAMVSEIDIRPANP
ncbi:MAG: SDR family NAD(P)-dependent oxidoreductase [Calditrichaeota bacterium]|nr:SDR family NAD(P)-dependent oxidoreductase [Calditrichota bacterium]